MRSAVPGIPLVVIGNKLDLGAVVPPGEAEGWAKYEGNMPVLQTSALTSKNVEEMFQGLAYLAYKFQKSQHELENTPAESPGQNPAANE